MKERVPASIAIQVLPQVPLEEIRDIVDKVIAHIDASGLTYLVGPYETTVEGDLDALLDLIKECQHICIAAGAPWMLSYIKIAYSPVEGVWSIAEKTDKYLK